MRSERKPAAYSLLPCPAQAPPSPIFLLHGNGPRPARPHGATTNSNTCAHLADVHGNMYGTSLRAVADVGASGKMCVLDIDVQGARQAGPSPCVRPTFLGRAPWRRLMGSA